MSEKSNKGSWYTSAADITMDTIDSQLFRADSVEDFLNNKHFIIAEKGIGKTLLLKKKKYDLLQKEGGILIPSGRENLDICRDFIDLTKNQISFLEQENRAKTLWSLAIQLSAIKSYDSCSEKIISEYNKELPSTYKNIFESKNELSNPSEIFHNLIIDIPNILHYIKDCSSIIDSLYKRIHNPVYIFIDRLDQAMLDKKNISNDMWVNVQTGLLEAAWNLNEHNSHIKIFCSIRKEAYDVYDSEVKGNLSGTVCFLNYRKDELYGLVNKLSEYYEKVKTIEDLVGIGNNGKFTHSGTGIEETVFGYILRHTVAKPRDLIRIASTLKGRIIPRAIIKDKIEELRNAANEAAEGIAKEIFNEKANFLDCIKDDDERERILSLIPKNTLSQETVKDICREFNKVKEKIFCTREQCLRKKSEGGCKHPFCELYNIGLFGYVKDDGNLQKQIFKMPDTKNVSHIVGSYSYYIVHPSLYKIITDLRLNTFGKIYIITPGITTGHDYEWGEKESGISNLVDYVLRESENIGDKKEKTIMKELIDKIKTTPNINGLSKEIKEKIKSIRNRNNKKRKKIFLSYCWKDKTIVDDIDIRLKKLKLNVTRDERDLKYKANVKEFMASLKTHDYVIVIISDYYLKSDNCMAEIGELLLMEDYKSKTLQIILPNANNIYDTTLKWDYNKYWKEKMEKLKSKLEIILEKENIRLIEADIKRYDEVIKNLPKFFEFITSEKGITQDDLETSDYRILLNNINNKKENT